MYRTPRAPAGGAGVGYMGDNVVYIGYKAMSYLDGVLDGDPRWGPGSGPHLFPIYKDPV